MNFRDWSIDDPTVGPRGNKSSRVSQNGQAIRLQLCPTGQGMMAPFGATTYANLRAWALSEPCEPILPPPNINQDNERQQNGVQKFIGKVKAMAQEKIEARKRAQEEEEDDDE